MKEARTGFAIAEEMAARKKAVDKRLKELGASVDKRSSTDSYAFRYEVSFDGDWGNDSAGRQRVLACAP